MEGWYDVLIAFATGLGSVATAGLSAWLSRRRAKRECDVRIDELKDAMHEGIEIEKHHHDE